MKNIDIDIDIDMVILENIDIEIDIDMVFLENTDIDKGILKNIDIDKMLYRLEFGISNRARWGGRLEISQVRINGGSLWPPVGKLPSRQSHHVLRISTILFSTSSLPS